MPVQVVAVNIRTLEITRNKESYHVTFDVLLGTEPEIAWKLLSDYRQWPRLSKNLKETTLLKTFPDGRQRVKLRFRSCILVFCKTVRQIKDVTTRPKQDIFTVMVSEQSDFTAGWEHWQIVAEHNKTRIYYTAEIVPSFRLPPLIGPSILKHKLRQTLIQTVTELEILATP